MHKLFAALFALALACVSQPPRDESASAPPNPYEDAAFRRAMSEFQCHNGGNPRLEVQVTARPDLGPSVYDIAACGHAARYACSAESVFQGYHRPPAYSYQCTREPDP
jgi:hypothetical protein